MIKKIFFALLAICLMGGAVAWYGIHWLYGSRADVVWEKEPLPMPALPQAKPAEEPTKTPEVPEAIPDVEIKTRLLTGVPFVSQAPFGEWNEPIHQDACEETSIMMAVFYLSGRTLTPTIGKEEIKKMAEYGEETFGHFVDTSAADTAKMMKEFYEVEGWVAESPTLEDIQRAVVSGSLVIVPADGRKLKNPNFTPPGPINHMLVITGYDAETKEFVTNDPGTRAGKNYRYDENVLFAAIRDYPTGKHLPNPTPKKAMIIVPPKEENL